MKSFRSSNMEVFIGSFLTVFDMEDGPGWSIAMLPEGTSNICLEYVRKNLSWYPLENVYITLEKHS